MTDHDSGAASQYLIDGPHWRVAEVKEFAAFFRAVHLLAPAAAFVALADGAWPSEVRASLGEISADPDLRVRGRFPREFCEAVWVPMGQAQMEALATLAERHAEPEIAIHIGAFTAGGSVVEWFDAPTDPIAVSPSVTPEAVSQFAKELGTRNEWVARGV
jgi:hypothetical protein